MNQNERIEVLIRDEAALEEKARILTAQLKQKQDMLDKVTKNIDIFKRVASLLTETSISIQEKTTQRISQIVTDMYQYVFLNNDRFIIQIDKKRSTPVASFYIETEKNGKKVLLDPITADGGGKVDVISLGLRLAALLLYSPAMERVLFLDEPLRFLSSTTTSKKPYRLRAVEFLKKIAQEYGIQVVAVTHDEELLSMADCIYNVSLDEDGYSKIEKMEEISNE